MPSLCESQQAFAHALRDPSAAAPGDVARASGQHGTRRFDVYRNNVAVSLAEALGRTFPAVERLVGAEFFHATARAYMAEEPPRSPILHLYGETFGDFLDAFPPASRLPYLGDVARLEFARLAAYHAADAEPIAIACLADIAPEHVGHTRLVFHPAARLICSRHPVASLWASLNGQIDAKAVDMASAEDVLVTRPALEVDMRILPAGGATFVERLMAGAELGEAAESAAAQYAGFDLATHLAGLFETGAISAARPA